MLKRLASTYFEQGKFEQCIQTYRRLIAEDPQSPDAPDYQNEIILAYQKIGRKQETLVEIDRLLKTYGGNSAWSRTNSTDEDAIKTATDYIEKNLRTVAINYHNEAKKLGAGRTAKETYALAYKAYSVYLGEFPESKYSYDVRYAFGELLYKIKRYDEAYEQYMKVVAIDAKGQHSKFCAESAIFAAEEMVKKEGDSKVAMGNRTEAVELSTWNANLLAACDQFSNLWPDDKKTKNVIYKSAYLLYNHNQFQGGLRPLPGRHRHEPEEQGGRAGRQPHPRQLHPRRGLGEPEGRGQGLLRPGGVWARRSSRPRSTISTSAPRSRPSRSASRTTRTRRRRPWPTAPSTRNFPSPRSPISR